MQLALCVGLAAVGAGAGRAPAGDSLWLELDRPAPDQRVRLAAPLVEVRGRTLIAELDGRRAEGDVAELVSADVVLALDLSNSSLWATGIDVDGDGKVGKDRRSHWPGSHERPHRSWTSDPDDTIIRAELLAAGTVVARLAQRGARLGVITYTGRPRTRAEVGSPERAAASLERIRIIVDWTGTDVSRALARASELLVNARRRPGPSRPKVVLLFSDGEPTAPHSKYVAKRRALKQSRELIEEGIQVYTLAFGEDAREDPGVLQEIAELTGGRFIPVLDPARVLDDLADVEFAKPGGLTIVNLTTGRAARAIRVFADGSFDGFVDLVPGENRIEVAATGPDGERVRVERAIHYEKPETETLEDRRRAARMLVELRQRRAETELAWHTGGETPAEVQVERESSVEVYPEAPPQP
ncbi:MAG: VWA domain-containing protein [Myxococcota bacterium]